MTDREAIARAMGEQCVLMLDELLAETPDPDACVVRKIKTVDGHHLKIRMDYLGFTGPATLTGKDGE